MGLSATAHDVVEVRPNFIDDWLAQGNDADVDALVLDLGSPSDALRLVGDMRAQGRWIPVLLVASSPDGWDSPDLLGLPGVDLLTLPIDSARLQRASDAVLRHPRTPPPIIPTLNPSVDPTPLIEDFETTDEVPEPGFLVSLNTDEAAIATSNGSVPEPGPDVESGPEPLLEPVPTQPLPPDPEPESAAALPVAAPAIEPSPKPEHTVNAPTVVTPIPVRDVAIDDETEIVTQAPKKRKKSEEPQAAPRPTAKTKEPRARKRARSLEPAGTEAPPKIKTPRKHAQTPPHPRRRATDRLPDQGPGEVVTAMLESANVLYTLSETAEVIVEDAIARADAKSGALLVPDGDAWRVAGGVGLRTLEFRYQLTAESWLIERVGESHRGLLIENSDVARQALHGAPLASRTHLLAVPVPDVTAVLLLSKDEDPPFTESVLAILANLAREAGPLLQKAIDLRTLARAMARHLDPEESQRV